MSSIWPEPTNWTERAKGGNTVESRAQRTRFHKINRHFCISFTAAGECTSYCDWRLKTVETAHTVPLRLQHHFSQQQLTVNQCSYLVCRRQATCSNTTSLSHVMWLIFTSLHSKLLHFDRLQSGVSKENYSSLQFRLNFYSFKYWDLGRIRLAKNRFNGFRNAMRQVVTNQQFHQTSDYLEVTPEMLLIIPYCTGDLCSHNLYGRSNSAKWVMFDTNWTNIVAPCWTYFRFKFLSEAFSNSMSQFFKRKGFGGED